MSTFTLIAILDDLDGAPSTGTFIIEPNTLLPGKVWDRYVAAEAVDGILSVPLPANDVAPYAFVYNVRRVTGGGRWAVPAQDPDVTVDLSDYRVATGTPSTPTPPPSDLAAQVAALIEVIAELSARIAALESGSPSTPGPVEDPDVPSLYTTTGTTETDPGLYATTGLVEDPTAPSLYPIGA